MKKLFVLLLLQNLSFLSVKAQWSFYVTGGISPESNPVNADLIVNRLVPVEEFLFNMTRVGTQYFGGLIARVDLNENFFAETGVVYTQQNLKYNITYTYLREKEGHQELSEIEDLLILPLSIGARLKSVEIQSGIDAFASLSRKIETGPISGFQDGSPAFHIGWHSGIQINLHRVLLGVEYQASLIRVCEGMTVYGESLALPHVPGQVKFNLKYRI